jgi:acetylornithine deacetylase
VTLSPREKRVLEKIDPDGMLAFLGELVAIPSEGGAETPAQERVAEWMEENGLEVDVWELDLEGLKTHPAYSAEIEREEALGVVGVIDGRGGGKTLILNGHVDVVPPGDPSLWGFSPWDGSVVDGRVRGRGSLDMKGGLACALFAAKAIQDAGVRLRGRLVLQSVVGEEDGGVGTLAAVMRGYRGDGAIIMEPTGLAICPAQAGALNFRITLRGRAAHGCVRDEGVSALEKLFPLYQELLALEAERNHNAGGALFRAYKNPFPLSVGRVEGGDWPSTVPDWIRVEGRYGLKPGEEEAEARSAFQRALDRGSAGDPWLRANPPELEWWGGRFLPATTPAEHPLVTQLAEVVEDTLGRSPMLEGVTYGSDLRHLVLEGNIPTVLFGPGDIRCAHTVDESVSVKDLDHTIRTLAVMALRFCGCEDD